jgi:tripartite-type tricarboxylate transporter receptor subunit TctC/uncharacterized caspase-like protein
LSLINCPTAFADKRVALVIGNSSYENVTRLDNPTNDAKLMAETLRALGFTVVGGGAQVNLNKPGIDRAVQTFGAQLRGADVGLFYYAGHGVQVRGTNYLVPVDANPTSEADVDFQMLDTTVVLRQMESAGTKLNLVILDACRNNPLGGRGLRATNGGLAQMQAPEGTLISFATQPGSVARDGSDGNSPYTKALAQTIKRPGLSIFDAFNEVGLAVMQATGNAQQPWVSNSPIRGAFHFADLPPAPAAAPVPAAPTQSDLAGQAWTVTKDTTSQAVLDDFIRQFGSTIYGSMARARLEELKKLQVAMVPPPAAPALPVVTRPTTTLSPLPTAPTATLSAVFTTGVSLGAAPAGSPPQTSFPTKPVSIVVPYSAGGGADFGVRAITQRMGEILKQPIIVDNKPGGAGAVAASAVTGTAADGHTLLFGDFSTQVLSPLVVFRTTFDPRKEFAPVGLIAASPMVIVVAKDFPATDLNSLIALLKTKSLKYVSSSGTDGHVACAQLGTLTGTAPTHISGSVSDLIAGKGDFMCARVATVASLISAGNLKALAVTSVERVAKLPNVPTTREAMLPALQFSSWLALFGPKAAPQATLLKLSYALGQALEDPTTRERLLDAFGEIPTRASRSPDALGKLLQSEFDKWGPVIKSAGIN